MMTESLLELLAAVVTFALIVSLLLVLLVDRNEGR
jgi:hypothetical protein